MSGHSHDTSTPAMSAETVPSEEFVLVPREPTHEMIVAGYAAYNLAMSSIRMFPEAPVASMPSPMGDALRAAISTLSASHLAKEGGEAGAVEAAYRKGVLDACELVGPPDDWTDAELTKHGRLKREAMHYARRELLKPLSVARAVSSLPQPSPALAKGGDAVREALEEARSLLKVEYYDDGRIAAIGHDSDGLRKMVALFDAALSTPTEGPASQMEGMGGDAVRATEGPYEVRVCKNLPTTCCDYGVVSLSAGREVCRVWEKQDAIAIAAALTPALRQALEMLASRLDEHGRIVNECPEPRNETAVRFWNLAEDARLAARSASSQGGA